MLLIQRMTSKGWRIALLCWMGLIFLASSNLLALHTSFQGTEEVFGGFNYWIRKLTHVGVYAVLTYIWFRSLPGDPERFWRCLFWSAVFSVFYGMSDEYHQSLTPLRSGKWSDVGWDTAGVMAMGGVLSWVRARGGEGVQIRWLGFKIKQKTESKK